MPLADLGAYGKLPCARDFLRVGRRLPDLEATVDLGAHFWMRAGRRDHTADTWLTCQPHLARIVEVWPSMDAGAQRAHPFAAFATLAVSDSLRQTLCALHPLRGDLARLRTCLADNLAPPTQVAFAPTPEQPLRAADWVAATFSQGADSLALALWQIDYVARGHTTVRAVRLPLANAMDPCVQAEAWLTLVPWLGTTFPHLVVPAPDTTPPSLTLLSPFAPDEISGLLAPGHAAVLDLTVDREPRIVAGFSSFARTCERRVASAGWVAELADLVARSG